MQFTLDKATVNGLRPDRTNERNRQFLVGCKNLACTEHGLKPLPTATYPCGTNPTMTMAWPFPQLLRGEQGSLFLCFEDTIYTVTAGTWAAANPYTGSYPNTECCAAGGFPTPNAKWGTGTGHAIANGVLTLISAANATKTYQSYLTYANPVLNGDYYRVTFTIKSIEAGGIRVNIGPNSSRGTIRYAEGTYVETLLEVANNQSIEVEAVGTTTAVVDNVSVQLLSGATDISTGAGVWHLASFQSFWLLTNGQSLVHYLPGNVGGNVLNVEAEDAEFAVATVCNHQNMLAFGGATGAYFEGAAWLAIFDAWRMSEQGQDYRNRMVISKDDAWSNEWIAVSRLGGGDLAVPFASFLAMFGIPDNATYLKLAEAIITDIEAGRIVLYRMQHTGPVLKILSLGDRMIVYGSRGISAMSPSEKSWIEEKIATVGIVSRGAVNGDDDRHVMVSTANELLEYRRGQGFGKVGASNGDGGGYQEFMETLTPALVSVSFDPETRYWWMGDGTKCYLLTRTGLCESDAIQVASAVRIGDSAELIGTAIIKGGTQPATIETDIFDGGQTGIVQIVFTRIASTDTDTTGWQVSVDARMRKNDTFTRSSAYTFDLRGVARTRQSGKEFRELLTAADRTLVDLERIEIEILSQVEAKPDLSNLL